MTKLQDKTWGPSEREETLVYYIPLAMWYYTPYIYVYM